MHVLFVLIVDVVCGLLLLDRCLCVCSFVRVVVVCCFVLLLSLFVCVFCFWLFEVVFVCVCCCIVWLRVCMVCGVV